MGRSSPAPSLSPSTCCAADKSQPSWKTDNAVKARFSKGRGVFTWWSMDKSGAGQVTPGDPTGYPTDTMEAC